MCSAPAHQKKKLHMWESDMNDVDKESGTSMERGSYREVNRDHGQHCGSRFFQGLGFRAKIPCVCEG